MFPGMGPLCTGQGQEKKREKNRGSAGGGKQGSRCMGTEEGQVVWIYCTFMPLYVKIFQLYNCKKKGCNSI